MNRSSPLLWLLSLLTLTLAFGADGSAGTPLENEAHWWRGNLHTHTLWSDGDSFPEQVAAWYKAHGYNFLVLSEHNIVARGEKWINPEKTVYLRGHGPDTFRRYLAEYGADWVETRTVDEAFHRRLYDQPGGREHRPEPGEISVGDRIVRLKSLNEYRTRFEATDRFLLVRGEEITDRPRTIHLNGINLIEPIMPQGATAETAEDTVRFNLNAILAQAAHFNRPMLGTLNHPNYMWAVSAEDMAAVENLRFFEVFNGGMDEDHINRHGQHTGADWGDATHPGTERMWDIALTLRLAAGGHIPLYGLATDDAHEHTFTDPGHSLPGRGWIMVRAPYLTPNNLVLAMQAGDFYASTGVVLNDVRFDGKTLAIDIAGAPGATYRTEFIGTRRGYDPATEKLKDNTGKAIATRYSRDVGAVLAAESGTRPAYTLHGDELYVRAVITSSETPDRPRRDGEFKKAWVQPVVPAGAGVVKPGEGRSFSR